MLVYVILAILLFVFYVKWQHTYWKRHGVYQLDTEFLFGNFKNELLGKASLFQAFKNKYKQLKALNLKHGGVYVLLKPVYVPVDLDIIKRILIKDFSYFQGHANDFHPKDNLSMNLFFIHGDIWRKLRTKLTPTFTSGKMKLMFDTLVEKTKGLEELVRSHVKHSQPLDVKEVAARFTTDIIVSCGFGLESNSLGENQDIQEKLRAEIKDVLEKHEGAITYEAIMEMTYLEMVVNETLRKYPPVPFIPRYCTKDYHVPGTDVIIKEGTQVQIPAWGIQTDPEYFPNPEKFNPENFSAENKSKIPEMAFIPFGEGPRMCIGLRFGKIQSKLALVSLLKNFRFTLNEKTHTPIEFTKVSFVLSVEGDVWLNVTEI
ncbi:cytochrome P450 9e2-like [Sitophilus oryzae]|uniref:Cytochrome P450 9e2-like n=1 Tax=Sitophilus oryzae TaxID=7048 RepID=A0A6J2Y4J4_SITOR|nr:cytochrome P450 9e2-like [Sitophilus oryzae]